LPVRVSFGRPSAQDGPQSSRSSEVAREVLQVRPKAGVVIRLGHPRRNVLAVIVTPVRSPRDSKVQVISAQPSSWASPMSSPSGPRM
jgi:hypothetical protein